MPTLLSSMHARLLPGVSIFAILVLGLLPVIHAISTPAVTVNLGYATYQGTFNSSTNTTKFLGIRYAAPPVGESFNLGHLFSLLFSSVVYTYDTELIFNIRYPKGNLRFQAPAPPAKTSGIQLANTQPPACPKASQGKNSTTPFRGLSKRDSAPIEDCLFLKCVDGFCSSLSQLDLDCLL